MMVKEQQVREGDIVAYSRDTVLNIEQVAAGLQVSARTVERLDIPFFLLGPRRKRYIWGEVLDFCKRRQE